jgi:hypothetical protein
MRLVSVIVVVVVFLVVRTVIIAFSSSGQILQMLQNYNLDNQ